MELPHQINFTKDPFFRDCLRMIYRYAWEHSEDESTKTGAVLVNEKDGLFAMNANHYPDFAKDVEGYNKVPLKYSLMDHGEDGAIKRARAEGLLVPHSVMIAPWYACTNCAGSIVQAEISEVIGHKQYFDRTPKDWIPDVMKGIEYLHKHGVKLRVYDGKIGGCQSRVRYKNWRP